MLRENVMKKTVCGFFIFAILHVLHGISLFSEQSFTAASLNEAGDILFSVKTDSFNSYSYETLFLYSKRKNKIEQLTFFPERLELLANNTCLQLSNRFGIARLDIQSGALYMQPGTEEFSFAASAKPAVIKNVQPSPDGKWLTLVEPSDPVFGRLVLIDTITGRKYILSEKNAATSYAVSWAPDSKTFLYEDGGTIYFAHPEWFGSNNFPDKRFRRLSEGTVKSIKWLSPLEFLFLKDNVLCKINAAELFTKSFYLPLFPLGKLTARFPFTFDAAADSISISPDGKTCVFIKGKRNVYFFKFEEGDYVKLFEEGEIPYLLLPGNTADVSVYWKGEMPFIFSAGIIDGKTVLRAWQISLNKNKFEKIPLPEHSSLLSGSSDFKAAAFQEDGEVYFYDTETWNKIGSFSGEKIISAVWKNSSAVFLGGENSLYEYTLDKTKPSGIKKRIAITSIKDFGWSASGDKILITIKSNYSDETAEYAGAFNWKTNADASFAQKKNVNASDRIYIDSSSGYFKNMIYIRSLNDFATKPLIAEPTAFAFKQQDNFPHEYGNTSSVFSHGNRLGKKQAALVFDAMNSMEGIAEVLYVLKRNNIKATFFINGEVLRQNPEAVKEICKAGHQCGSLFFTAWNLNDTEYGFDENFIMQGLARNEDTFYRIAGCELSLIWHSPNYIVSPMIITAGRKAGYVFVSPDIRIPDWISSADKPSLSALYKPSAEIIGDICAAVRPGSIIPIRLGKTKPERGDYLYSNVQLLIDSLSEMGFSLTDIKTLMEN